MVNNPMVTDAQQRMLKYLAEHQNPTIDEVARALYVRDGEQVNTNRMHGKRRAVGTVLSRLRAVGFAQDYPSSDGTIWAITDLGREALQ